MGFSKLVFVQDEQEMTDVLLSKGGREMKPLLLRAGLTLAISLAGYFFSRIGVAARRRSPLPPPDEDSEEDGYRQSVGGPRDDAALINEEVSPSSISVAAPSDGAKLSSKSRGSGDEEAYLLPEFNDLVWKEFEDALKEPDILSSRASTPKKLERKNLSAMDEEIVKLKNLVQSLQERENELEFRLLECFSLMEQESAARELENRLKISSVESKLLSMKIESLKVENQRLETQLSDSLTVEAELGTVRERIELLKRKMSSNSEQAEEKIAALHARLTVLQVTELELRERDENLELILMRLKDFEDEAANLSNENLKLAQENLDLTKKLEFYQISAPSLLNFEGIELSEEANHLQERNDELLKEIEQLQMDRGADVEELVYLKWLNACLRYELRDYQHPEGKIVARELGKTHSPKSEEKAKQLILEYANLGNNEKFLVDFDSECCSSSQSSSITEYGEMDDSSVSTKASSNSSKMKFFGKLKKLVLGKEAHSEKMPRFDITRNMSGYPERKASISNYSSDDMFPRHSFDSVTSCVNLEHSPNNQLMHLISDLEKHSLEEAQLMKDQRCRSDLGSVHGYKRFSLGDRGRNASNHSIQTDRESIPEKEELKKFAKALMNTARTPQFRRKS